MRLHSLLTATLLLATATRPAAAQDRRVGQMRAYLKAAAGLGQVSGSVLVAERGKILLDTAYGFANRELGVRNTPDTRFRVASVTKQFTAMAIVMLAQEGRLNLTDPVSRFLDSIPDSWSGVTLHHLLRHTAGISDYEGWFDGYDTQAYSDYMAQADAPGRIAREARRRPLDFAPGAQFSYSNSAYILLGQVVEKASGVSYEEYLRTRILEPLGMTRSGQDHSDEILPDRADGYRLRPGAFPRAWFNGLTPADYLNAHYQLMVPPQGDAGLVTTARDLYRWDRALETEKLVRRALLDSIFTPGLEGYGYGWFIEKGPEGTVQSHSGGLPGFACLIMRLPDQQRTIILLGNNERMGRTVRDLATILRGQPVAPPRARHLIAPDSAASAAFGGTYRLTSGDSVSVAMDGEVLVAHWREHFRAALLAEGAQDYFMPQLNGVARFRPVAGGMELVIIDEGGKELVRAKREP